ncbi:hypothetical protein [Vibrio harveyi]|uniref:hypothetical protein n=1 Tax=Vibrio harveyi TaxID=669 RepID=UPI000680BD63|nr:hypothetical protein [Vibrio harveyi]
MESNNLDDFNKLQFLFTDLSQKLSELSERDVAKLLEGNYEITLKITRKKATHSVYEISQEELSELVEQYNTCASREEGHHFLRERITTKKMLEYFAKNLDVMVLKQDKIEVLREKIVESTIGAKLRSSAIQGTSRDT